MFHLWLASFIHNDRSEIILKRIETMNITPSEPPVTPSGKSRLGLFSTLLGASLYLIPIASFLILVVVSSILGLIDGETPASWFYEKDKTLGGLVFVIGLFFSVPVVGILILFVSTTGLVLGVLSLRRKSERKGLAIAGILLNVLPFLITACLALLSLLNSLMSINL